MTNPFPPATGGIEINLSNDAGQEGAHWSPNAQTSLTNNPDTSSGFKSMDYVPGHAGSSFAEGDMGDLANDLNNFDGGEDEGTGFDLGDKGKKIAIAAGAVLVLGVIGFLGLGYLEQEGMSLEDLFSMIMGTDYDPGMVDTLPTPKKPKKTPAKKPELAEGGLPEASPLPETPLDIEPSGPLVIPNKIDIDAYRGIPPGIPDIEPMSRIWSAQEEEVWRRGITHSYPWQRYKTVLEVKSSRLIQSRVILWDALEDEHLWVRMRAVMALAEFGVPVKKLNVEKAIGLARKSLVANFVKRFIQKSSPGERYVLKHAIAMVNSLGRISILRTFNNEGFHKESLEYYVVAALNDPNWRVRRYAQRIVNNWSQSRVSKLQAELAGFDTSTPAFEQEETLKVPERETLPSEDDAPIPVDDVTIYQNQGDDINYDDIPDYDVEFDDF